MISFIVYCQQGSILRTGVCQKDALDLQAASGEIAIEGTASDKTQYISDGEVVDRPVFDITVDGYKLTGLPVGTEVVIDGELAGTCGAGCVEIEKESELDTVAVRLSLFPYIDKEITL